MASALQRYFGGSVQNADDYGHIGFTAVEGKTVPSGAKGMVQQLAKMPSSLSANDVVEEARNAGKDEMSAHLFKKFVGYRKRRIQAGLETYQTGAEFTIEMMRAAEKAGHVDNRFARELAKHNISMQAERAQVAGYDAALSRFETQMGGG